MTTPQFVVIGHVVRDLTPGGLRPGAQPEGWRLGGTATYAAVQAQRLGLNVGVVTRVGPEVSLAEALPGVAVAGRRSACTTSFENIYEGTHRRQRVPSLAEPLAEEDVPPSWRAAPIVLLGPVFGEVPPGWGGLFSRSLVGVSAQGWLRRVDRHRRVRRQAWTGPPFWSGCRALFVSDEDLGRRRDQLARWLAEVPLVALTRNWRGARIHAGGSWRTVEAFPAREEDPTGAGDIFAAAFLVRYHETEDVGESARFASAAAACSVEAPGVELVADRLTIEARMRKHPEIVLR